MGWLVDELTDTNIIGSSWKQSLRRAAEISHSISRLQRIPHSPEAEDVKTCRHAVNEHPWCETHWDTSYVAYVCLCNSWSHAYLPTNKPLKTDCHRLLGSCPCHGDSSRFSPWQGPNFLSMTGHGVPWKSPWKKPHSVHTVGATPEFRHQNPQVQPSATSTIRIVLTWRSPRKFGPGNDDVWQEEIRVSCNWLTFWIFLEITINYTF